MLLVCAIYQLKRLEYNEVIYSRHLQQIIKQNYAEGMEYLSQTSINARINLYNQEKRGSINPVDM